MSLLTHVPNSGSFCGEKALSDGPSVAISSGSSSARALSLRRRLEKADADGDGTWPLRQARDIHVTLVRALMKTSKFEIEDAINMSQYAWYEAWRRTDVNEESFESGRHVRHVHMLMSAFEVHEDPQPPQSCLMMDYPSLERLKSEQNLLVAKTSDDTVYECVYPIHGT